MRRVHRYAILLICAGFLTPLLWAQNPQSPGKQGAPAGATLTDAEANQLVQDVTTGDWDKVAHPAVKRIATLNNTSKAKLIPLFMDILGDPDHNFTAEEALAAIGAPALPALFKAVQTGTGERQKMAVAALGEMVPKPKSAIPVLLAVSKTMDNDLRGWVIESLGKIGPAGPDAPTTAPTLALLMAAFNDYVNGSERSLGRFGAPAVPGLRKILQTSSDSKMKVHAISALADMEALAAPATPELMEAMKDPATRVDAIWALNQIGPPAKQAMPLLKKVVLKDPQYWADPGNKVPEDRARKYAMQALVKMGVETDFLIQAMKDGAPGASGALSAMGAAIVPRMRAMLSDPNIEYRRDALGVLGSIGAPATPAVPDMIQAMAEKQLRVTVLSSLAGIGPGATPAVPALIHSLLDEDERFLAMEALGAIGPAAKEAVPFLIDILQGKPQFTSQPPPPGYHYVYGEKAGEMGRQLSNAMSEYGAKEALTKIGTPEALAAVNDYNAKHPE